jgi:hypothetical protein
VWPERAGGSEPLSHCSSGRTEENHQRRHWESWHSSWYSNRVQRPVAASGREIDELRLLLAGSDSEVEKTA